MKTLYLELNMGASGDMLMSTLYELVDDKEGFLEKMNSLGYKNVEVKVNDSMKNGISGKNISIIVDGIEEESVDVDIRNLEIDHHHHDHDYKHDHHHNHTHEHSYEEHDHNHDHTHEHNHHHGHSHNHSHSHNGLTDVIEIIKSFDLSDSIKENAISIYKLIGKAESKSHNKPMDEVHFHEVGTIDAIYDIVGNCILMDMINPEKIIASPINLGSGMVKCQHGIMPVPAPATAYILKDIPVYKSSIKGELCTPTGAALLKHFVEEFTEMPVMEIEKIGYGMGKKDFEAPNCVRGFLGKTQEQSDEVIEFKATIDDMTGEEIGYLFQVLFNKGALEIYTTNIMMKKNRPGIELTIISKEENKETIIKEIFSNTTTIGIKHYAIQRTTLERTEEVVETEFGSIRKKVSKGFGVEKGKFEYEDLVKIAKDQGLSLFEIKNRLK